MADKPPPSLSSSKPPPTIALPPRTLAENLFIGAAGASPGPMSLVSSFFAENDRSVSFSELLAGAMSPEAAVDGKRNRAAPPDSNGGGGGNRSGEFRFQQDNSDGLLNPQGTVTIPPGMSPASLLDSPDFFSSLQGSFGMPHQQFLSRVTAQAQSQAHMQMQYPSSTAASVSSLSQLQPLRPNEQQQIPPPLPDPKESSDISHSDQKFQPPNITVDKPTDDGYNWRKYGQKQVKGSEFPRSYYKCTNPSCLVKKKVERSLDGQITEIIYKGQHNHPQPSKRTRDTGNANGLLNTQGNSEFGEGQTSNFKPDAKNQGSSRVTPDNASGSSDSDGVGNAETRGDERDEDEPESKRRNVVVQNPEQASNHRTVTEPRIIVQTTSEVDLLDDGYRWRKYGQKVVKGNPYPRSYYKCTSTGCNVRKHVERAATDPKAVITTYEGKHTHDVPAARNSSHSNAASQLRPQNSVVRPVANRGMQFGNEQQSVALLRFKEEQTS